MKLNYIDEKNFDPNILVDIDVENSIILSTLENNNITITDKELFLNTNNEINIYNQKLVGDDIFINFSPIIKWSVPNDVSLKFTDSNKESPFLEKIYTKYNFIKKEENYSFFTINFILHINKNQIDKNMVKINRNQQILAVNIDYGIFRETPIDNLYIIKNDYIFEDFLNHFER